MARRSIWTASALVATGLFVATALAFVALRDVAGRIGPSPTPAAEADDVAPASTGIGSAFSPGPRLGDLKALFAHARGDSPPEFDEPERLTLDGVTVDDGSSGRTEDDDRRPRTPRKPRKPEALCDLPAMC